MLRQQSTARASYTPHRALFQFRRDVNAVAAVEFAVLLPFILLIYIGAVDVTRGVIASRKLNLLSRTISDIVSQQSPAQTLSASAISNIFAASSAVMHPFNTTGLTMTVSAVDIKAKSDNTCCQVLVRWSYTQGGTLRGQPSCSTPLTQVTNGTSPSATTIPAALVTANQTAGYGYTSGQTSYLIISDVSYTYVPFFYQAVAWFSGGMTKTNYMVPRSVSGTINLASPISAPTGQSGVICISP